MRSRWSASGAAALCDTSIITHHSTAPCWNQALAQADTLLRDRYRANSRPHLAAAARSLSNIVSSAGIAGGTSTPSVGARFSFGRQVFSFLPSFMKPATCCISIKSAVKRESFSSVWLPESYITRNGNRGAFIESPQTTESKTTSVKKQRGNRAQMWADDSVSMFRSDTQAIHLKI